MKPTKVLFVCLGNICRSPTAEGVFQKMVDNAGLSHSIIVDSAGTSGWHINEPPDMRSAAAAAKAGYDLSALRGRKFIREDFENFDYILAMDESNLAEMEALKPQDYTGHLGLFLEFAESYDEAEVPDPYYGGGEGFTFVLQLIEDASRGLLERLAR